MLVNVPRLVTAYYTGQPDPSVAAQRVTFGTSGHRGSSLRLSFNEAHILAITQAICQYRAQHEVTGPLFLAMDTHALSDPAWASALEVLSANRVDTMIDSAWRLYADSLRYLHAILDLQPRAEGKPGGWYCTSPRHTIRPKMAASSTTRRAVVRRIPARHAGSKTARTGFYWVACGKSGGCPTRSALKAIYDTSARLCFRVRE